MGAYAEAVDFILKTHKEMVLEKTLQVMTKDEKKELLEKIKKEIGDEN